jgi:hypothetical protein
MAPSLRIPVSYSLDEWQRQSNAVASGVEKLAKHAADQFSKLNADLVGLAKNTAGGAAMAYGQSAARTAVAFATAGAAVILTGKLIGAVIDQTREQLEKILQLADKAQSATVTPRFFQAFTAEAEKLKVPVSELEGALNNAFNATKGKSPIDVDAWSTGEEQVNSVEKALRVYNETVAKAAGQQLGGLIGFRDARNQEERIQAVLRAMVQLEDLGQKAAALDVGEKMFGGQFVDRIRQGKTSAAEMLATIQEVNSNSRTMFSNEIIQRAKQVDDELKRAYQTLDRELKPTWDSLADKMLSIKQLWADVINLMAKAASLFPASIMGGSNGGMLGKLQTELHNYEALGDSSLTSIPGLAWLGERENAARIARIQKLRENIEALLELQRESSTRGGFPTSRGTGPAPTPPKSGGDDSDTAAFDRAIDSANKHAAAMEADAKAVGLSEAAHARLRVEAALVEALLQDGVEDAGKYADQIAKVGERTQSAAQQLENAKTKFEGFNDTLKFAGGQIVDVLDQAMQKGADFGQIMEGVLRNLIKQMLLAAITGEGAFAKMFGTQGIGGGVGGIMSLFLSGRAAGGPVSSGRPYIVGEHGPEIFVPNMAGGVVPNAGAMAAAPVNVQLNVMNYGDSQVETRQKRNAQGGATLDVLIDRVTAANGNRMGTLTNRMLAGMGAEAPLNSRA